MKLIRVICMSLLVLCYGMPLPVHAQTATAVYSFPDVRAGELYRVNIDSVLRDKYRLRLETTGRPTLFRWAFNGGELPPGLTVRPNGTVAGTPIVPRAEPYNFQVRVAGSPGAEPLILNLSLTVTPAKVRLVQVSAPKLVPLDGAADSVKDVSRNDPTAFSAPLDATPSSNASFFNGETSARSANVNYLLDAAPGVMRREAPARFITPAEPPAPAAASGVSGGAARPQNLPPPPCDINAMPAPSAAPGARAFTLDARNGNLYEKEQLVTSTHRFKRNERAVVVVDNKNPYLYTYKLTIQATPVPEPALDAFVPLIVGSLGEFKPKTPPAGASTITPTSTPTPIADDPCKPAKEKVRTLIIDKDNAVGEMIAASGTIETQVDRSRRLTDAYNNARLPLFAPNQTRASLHNGSKNFIQVIDPLIGPANGVDRKTLADVGAELERLTRVANRLKSRVEAIREAHPDCLNEDNEGELISEQLRQVAEAADELLADAARFEKSLNEIRTDLQKVIDARTNVLKVLCDPRAFFSESVVGQFEETNDVDIQLEATPRQGVAEAQQIPASPFKTKFTFGNAPFFSISGGLIFSPLRKREYVRVQGFELDAQGNQVLVDGKPNLTTVIGLKESSPTRIIPAVFLNGLLTERKTGFVDGVHFTLGITAKNDNKGTDVEFLVGPSLSMLERRMFFTFGGYAGKQQKLAGNLFEGLALPSGVSEIPVEKNYRWSFGFALSYRIPVTK
jgi:hypothetical protein